jgi:hypothetical protein
LTSRGKYPVKIKTINGSFRFEVKRYETSAGLSNWLKLVNPELGSHYETELLREFSLRYCTVLSYEKTSRLVADRCGTTRLSDQRLGKMVWEKAAELTHQQAVLVEESQLPASAVKAVKVDLYDAQAEEVIWLSDGICVCEQKAKRDKKAKVGKERTTTDLAMLKCRDGSYKTIVVGEGVEKVGYYQAEIVAEYGERSKSLAVVAISDGARSLKKEAQKVFGEEVCHILDWYHLQAKVYQLMSQIAVNKEAKEEANQKIINLLWEGESKKAVNYLRAMASKNESKQLELRGYIEKNENYIINYKKRKEAGKLIGSGRMEKENDVIVAIRQKGVGMSWSKLGSHSLAMVTSYFHPRTNYLQ